MQRTATDLEPEASAEQVRKARQAVLAAAKSHALSDVSLANDGTLVVHVDEDPTYREVLGFITDVKKVIGAAPRVITDDSPASGTLKTKLL
ncbi:MAG: hypothetical protein ACR2FO_09040 [Actinomycetota bacterium]